MQSKEDRRHVAGNVWSARVIPLVLLGIISYATYVTVGPLSGRLCWTTKHSRLTCSIVTYLLVKHHDSRAVIPILIIHLILLVLMLSSFFRLVYITFFDPPVLPLGPIAVQERQSSKRKSKKLSKDEVAGSEYKTDSGSGGTSTEGISENDDPDSPGLEMFYTKDIFVCQLDGKPKFCSQCANWKFDRTHHCSMNNRCILKMDHFCPWIGGPLGESNIKYFIQFNGYTALYCAQIIVIMAIYLKQQRSEVCTQGRISLPIYSALELVW